MKARHARGRRWGTGPKPVFGSGRVRYEIGARFNAMSYGGIGVVRRLVSKLGLAGEIDGRLGLLKRHLPYHESDHMLNIAYNLLCGGMRMEDLGALRNNAAYMDALGAEVIPSPLTPPLPTASQARHPVRPRAPVSPVAKSLGDNPGPRAQRLRSSPRQPARQPHASRQIRPMPTRTTKTPRPNPTRLFWVGLPRFRGRLVLGIIRLSNHFPHFVRKAPRHSSSPHFSHRQAEDCGRGRKAGLRPSQRGQPRRGAENRPATGVFVAAGRANRWAKDALKGPGAHGSHEGWGGDGRERPAWQATLVIARGRVRRPRRRGVRSPWRP